MCVAVRVSHHGGGRVRRSASVSSCMACGLQVSVYFSKLFRLGAIRAVDRSLAVAS